MAFDLEGDKVDVSGMPKLHSRKKCIKKSGAKIGQFIRLTIAVEEVNNLMRR